MVSLMFGNDFTFVCRENIIQWDMAETAKGGPFPELLDGESGALDFTKV